MCLSLHLLTYVSVYQHFYLRTLFSLHVKLYNISVPLAGLVDFRATSVSADSDS